MFFQTFPQTEEEEEEDVLKEEEEEKSVCGDPFVVVKLEDEREAQEAERSERSSGCSGSALDISLFAPLESSEDAEEEERPPPLSHTRSRTHPACWPSAPGTYLSLLHTPVFLLTLCVSGQYFLICICKITTQPQLCASDHRWLICIREE